MCGLLAVPLERFMSEPPFNQYITVHAEAVVIRNGVPIDDDGNPIDLDTTSTED